MKHYGRALTLSTAVLLGACAQERGTIYLDQPTVNGFDVYVASYEGQTHLVIGEYDGRSFADNNISARMRPAGRDDIVVYGDDPELRQFACADVLEALVEELRVTGVERNR